MFKLRKSRKRVADKIFSLTTWIPFARSLLCPDYAYTSDKDIKRWPNGHKDEADIAVAALLTARQVMFPKVYKSRESMELLNWTLMSVGESA